MSKHAIVYTYPKRYFPAACFTLPQLFLNLFAILLTQMVQIIQPDRQLYVQASNTVEEREW